MEALQAWRFDGCLPYLCIRVYVCYVLVSSITLQLIVMEGEEQSIATQDVCVGET